MEKTRILNISKNESRSQYDFPKEQKLFGLIRKILYSLGFEEGRYGEIKSFGRPLDQENKTILDKEDDIHHKDYDEVIDSFSNENYIVDIIFFSKKISIVLHYKKDKQQEISEIIGNFVVEGN